MSASATKPPSPFFKGITISSPVSNPFVQAVPVCSTRRRWSRQTNAPWSLRTSPPGSRWASVSIWKPLQMPRTGSPRPAAAITSVMIGDSAAIAPHRK